MNSGILLLDKKEGISSAKCVYLARKKLSIKKIGHAGTLDPFATGMLPLLINKATRVSDYLMDEIKVYETLAYFGKKTDTQDRTGEIIDKSDNSFNKEELLNAIESEFIGDIKQTPPMYSALKHNGKKLYELAREGKTIERKQRDIKIYDFEIIEFKFPYARFKITCSKGTYIRTLINDLGEKLNTFAYVSELRRLKVGNFSIEDSISVDELEKISLEKLNEKILKVDYALKDMPEVILDKSYLKQVTNGMTIKINLSKKLEDKNLRIYVEDEFVGIGQFKNEKLKLKKVFYEG